MNSLDTPFPDASSIAPRDTRKGASNKRNDAMRKQVCDLYLSGKSVKEIGKIIGRSQALAFKWVKQAGILRPKSEMIRLRYGREQHEIHQADAFKSECKAFLIGDELTHWVNHPIVWREHSRIRGIEHYYKNHEENKKKSRESAKKVYYSKRNNLEWREKRRAAFKAYASKNRNKLKESKRLYFEKLKRENPAKLRAYKRTARQNPKNKIVWNLRRRLRDIIHGRHGIRGSELIGCNRDFLVKWIEKQFKRGMSWGNYGTAWHIDHIQPCAAFRLEDKAEAKKCFHYSNLRPLWAKDNMDKGDKIVPTQPELCMAI